jgi:hypothetical protein
MQSTYVSNTTTSDSLRPISGGASLAISEGDHVDFQSKAGVKRLSLQVSSQLHREAKLAAIEDEETLNSMVVTLLRRHLNERRATIDASQRRGAAMSWR